MGLIGNGKVSPSETKVERQALSNFPIILYEDARFILMMHVANPLRERRVVLESVELVRILHVAKLTHAHQRAREKSHEIAQSRVITCRGRACQSGHIRARDRPVRDESVRSVTAGSSWNRGRADAGVKTFGVSSADLPSELERVLILRPADGVTECPQRRIVKISARRIVARDVREVHRPGSGRDGDRVSVK